MNEDINGLDEELPSDNAESQSDGAALRVDTPPPGDLDAGGSTGGASSPADPNDEIPVPIAMWPSEIDERAQVVEALRGNAPPPRTDTQIDPA